LQASRVRRADHLFRWILLVIAAMYIAVAVVMSIAGRRGGPTAALALLVIVLAAFAAFVWLGIRIRAYSRAGILWYVWAIAAFNIWNAVLVGVSIGTGFWASTQPVYHFGVTVLAGVIPLIVAAYLIGRR
jgi:hypothetical protein